MGESTSGLNALWQQLFKEENSHRMQICCCCCGSLVFCTHAFIYTQETLKILYFLLCFYRISIERKKKAMVKCKDNQTITTELFSNDTIVTSSKHKQNCHMLLCNDTCEQIAEQTFPTSPQTLQGKILLSSIIEALAWQSVGLLSLTNKGLHIKGIGLGDDSLPCKSSVLMTRAMKFWLLQPDRGKPLWNEQSGIRGWG